MVVDNIGFYYVLWCDLLECLDIFGLNIQFLQVREWEIISSIESLVWQVLLATSGGNLVYLEIIALFFCVLLKGYAYQF
jgi:hypothetical protein